MSLVGGIREKMKRVKGAEWAMLLIVLGLVGSLLLSPGGTLLGGSEQSPAPSGAVSDALEDRLSRVLSSMEGVGRVEVVIHYSQPAARAGTWLDTQSQDQAEGEPLGVVVVAEGAGDLRVRLEISRAVQTLLRLSADAVEVFSMGESDKKGEV